MKPRKSRHWLSRKFTCFLVLLAMLFSMAGGAINPAPVYAANDTESDAATSLTIKAGTATSSNPTTVYTTLKTFSEEEMTAKATTQQMYSYFDSMPAPVKDAATGVPLADLLNEVGISLDNVERIYFYCTDITTGPYSNRTKAYLFDTPRYYFPLIGDSWDPDEYKPAASGTWGDDPTAGKVAVEPMLAVSDNWKRVLFAGEPDFNTQDTGTRFRLVNGQSESDYLNGTITASTSAKWVHEIDVKLISAPVTGVTLDQSAITLAPGESEQLTATVTPAYASDPSVSWSSDNPSAATVEANGVITAVAGGNATITVTTTDGSFTATCAVTVDVEAPGPQTPPTLTADTTDNTVGQAVDITFTDDEAWRTAISGITVGGTPLTGEQYTVTAGNINIAAAVFTAAGDYSIAVTANGYSDAAVTQTINETSPPPGKNADDVYELFTADHMLWFANQVNSGSNNAIKGKLMQDIDLSEVTWTPIGASTMKYAGTFDGGGHEITLALDGGSARAQGLVGYAAGATIKDLTVSGFVTTTGIYAAGFVAYAEGVTIQNCTNRATVSSKGYAAGLLGYSTANTVTLTGNTNEGAINLGNNHNLGGIACYISGGSNHVIENCTNKGTVTGGSTAGGILGRIQGSAVVSGCVNEAAVSVTGGTAGGIVGYVNHAQVTVTDNHNKAAITSNGYYYVGGIIGRTAQTEPLLKCSNTGTISGSAQSAGGIVGSSTSEHNLSLCYNAGDVSGTYHIGGIAGNSKAIIADCYNTGRISASAGTENQGAGGIAGTSANSAITNCYSTGTVVGTGNGPAGAVVGRLTSGSTVNSYYLEGAAALGVGNGTDTTTSKTEAEMKDATFAALLGSEYIAQDDAYPILAWQGTPAAGPYSVTVDSAITGGAVTVDPANGSAGDTITVTVTPGSGKQLVAGSLKYNDGVGDIEITATEGVYSFILPAANVTVTAQFEDISAGVKTPPTLTPDSTNNNVGQVVDITFTDDETWRTAISGITVGGTPLTGEQYTVTAGNINIAAGVFTAAGDYSIAVTANGYSDAAVTQTMTTGGPQIPVSLSLSKSAASTGEWITASGTGPANTWISLRVLDADGNVVVFDAVKSDSQGNYSIEFGVPAAEGDALNVIVGFGTNIASATLGLKLDPPALTADTSNNVVGQSIDITFSPDTDWQAAISGITVNGNNLTSGQYTISDGNINITAGAFSAAGSYQITVTAAGYKDAQVTQTIAAKTPPALTADTINNVVGQSIDITFSPDADWQEAISGITVNGNNLSSGQYTISDGNINITAGAFSAAGSYQITVTAANYADATVNQEILGAAPGLTADITNNSPEQTIEITFTDNEAWRNAITGITVDEVSIAGKYTIAPGVITLDNTVFTETGSFSVAVKATGYADATVTQNILNPCYLITPEADQIYVISENQDGIKIMTVNPGVSGMKYFNVGVTPVRIHNGKETLVFVHKRDGLQLSLNTSRGDFGLIDGGGAGFNVSAGDIIKVYMVDQLTNDINFNPTIFQ
jgi:hypothetical protein